MKLLLLIALLGGYIFGATVHALPASLPCRQALESTHVQNVVCAVERQKELLARVPAERVPDCSVR